MKKRIFSLALAFVLALGTLTGCKADREEVASADSTTTSSATEWSTKDITVATLPTTTAWSTKDITVATLPKTTTEKPTESTGIPEWETAPSATAVTPSTAAKTTSPKEDTKPTTTAATTTSKPVEADSTNTDYSMFEKVSGAAVPNTIINSDDQTFIKYTYADNNLKPKEQSYAYLYDFDDEKWVGYGRLATTTNYSEMKYGLHGYIEGNTLFIRMYSNCNLSNAKLSKAQLISDDYVKNVRFNPDIKTYNKINTNGFANGLYKFAIQITYDYGYSEWIELHFYVNKGKTWFCSYAVEKDSHIKEVKARRAQIASLIKEYGITPENSVSTARLCYPWYSEWDGFKCDTPELIQMSYDLIEPGWSDARKVLAYYEWITSNMSYDYYKLNVTGISRAGYYKDYSGKWNPLTTKTGVCADFTNMLATMCRAQGIPSISIEQPGHTWNLIYLYDKWIEVDATVDVRRAVYGEDVTKVVNADDKYNYDGYMTLCVNTCKAKGITLLNDGLWTVEKATKGKVLDWPDAA